MDLYSCFFHRLAHLPVMLRKLKKAVGLTRRPETRPEFHDDAAAVQAAARAGRIRPEFMTQAQIDAIHPPFELAPGRALTVDEAAARLTHLRFRSSEWWKAMKAATGLRLVEILEQIGDEIDHDDDPDDGIAGIINRNLGR